MAAELEERDEKSGVGLIGKMGEDAEKHGLEIELAFEEHGEERRAGVEAFLGPERAALHDLLRRHRVRKLQSLQRHGDREEKLLRSEDLRRGSGFRDEPRQIRGGDEEQAGHWMTRRGEEKRRSEMREILGW